MDGKIKTEKGKVKKKPKLEQVSKIKLHFMKTKDKI